MEDPVAEGSRLGKMAIQSDAAGDYKQAYYLYQECLKQYVDALRSESQEDRIEWTHEQVLIRFERLAELNAWYKRKNQLEPGWLELDDLRDRLETVAPKISTKLRKFSYVPVQSVPDTAQGNSAAAVSSPSQTQAQIVGGGGGAVGGSGAGSTGGGYHSPPASETPSQVSAGGYGSPQATSPYSQQPIPPPQQPVQQPVHQQQTQPPVQPQIHQQQSPPSSYPPSAGGIPPNPAQYNGEHVRRESVASSGGGHQAQPPSHLGYNHQGVNGVASPQQPYQQGIPPNPATQYGAQSPGPYGSAYPPPQASSSPPVYPPQDPNQLTRVGTFPAGSPQQQPVVQQPDPRTYLLTPFLRISLPVKMYHCYGAAQRYRGGAEGWNIEIKDGSKNPIYYLYGLKQANATLVEMSLHREDGKKTRCMDIYTPAREGRQVFNIGDMSYKHYLPTPVDIFSQGEVIPNGPKKRIFTFSGRRFMWKPDAQSNNNLVNESLYEIDDGPQGFRPSQAGGLLGDGKPLETKLAWYEHTMARKKLGRINVVAGLELSIEEIFLGTMLGHLCTMWEATRKGM
ncbi:hypothetical protein TWF718_004969 [Orbilia javanica]|uniref:MIT domain-containing protein n=1 Tax=Orbilia javanica TaxID=47235 RepID=A0AAN8MYJ3_9PEZI